MTRLYDMTKVLRTKQAGPFEMSFDLLFNDEESYRRAKESNVINPELISRLYLVDPSDVRVFRWFDMGHALKITIPRRHPSGSPGERDLYADQQHVLLEDIVIP